MRQSLKRLVPFSFLLSLLLSLTFGADSAYAFYDWQNESSSLEMRGMLQASALTLNNPNAPLYYSKRHVAGATASGRLMLDATAGESLSFEIHLEQSYVPTDLQTGGSTLATIRDVERTSLLDWSFDNRRAHLRMDRLNVQYQSGKLNLKIGRQPISLASTYYFTPNDFFAPFAAQTFFRSYKPGVDAARADIRLGELSQLSLISVLGYTSDPITDNGWSDAHQASRSSHLVRASSVFGDFELALLGGLVRKDRVLGLDFQGELFEWLGVRGEGHVKWPDAAGQRRSTELSLGLEHRWESSLTARLEQFYHGSGATKASAYNPASLNNTLYLARHYSAVGASYEFTPLLTGDATALYNWIDRSGLLALYALYSLSDESEIAFSGNASFGKSTPGAIIQSEFGLYGDSLSVEYRLYF